MNYHRRTSLVVSEERVTSTTADADQQLTLSEFCGGPRIVRFAPDGGFPLPSWIRDSRARLARRIREFNL